MNLHQLLENILSGAGVQITITVRARQEFVTHLEQHINEIDHTMTINDYILSAVVEKMRSELDDEIPAPKAPSGYSKTQVPEGWKSRLYPDRWELVVAQDGQVHHLHEYDISAGFRHQQRRWGDAIDGKWQQANVYIHTELVQNTYDANDFEDSTIGQRVREFIRAAK